MPELPEVETVVRTLRPAITGRRILNAEFLQLRVLRGSPLKTAKALAGRRIESIERYGKFIAIRLDRGFLVVHLGMTGKLLVNAEPTKWTHAVFTLDRGVLHYDDQRQFGRIEYGVELPERVVALGPEPLEITLSDFIARVRARKSPIKAVLLNQAVIRGMGNIYADEALFRAGVHPKRSAASLRKDRIERIYDAMREVLVEAIDSRGSSVSNYVDADGRKGSFQTAHRVYRRTGRPCTKCGSKIERIVLVQRGTHFCPKCQR
ncbi:MAG TPA: bifunctional DNA-formamidopyrimidine glycosylase/DNA-(apurinic or apyrimidinic site) lyase [Bryobacteraceae bacterium]|jgi:formamidopyrimidine-DNA glycosylase|nr:bifunctional DNA-formamidopyrimidine glycosylase/DNA-(apurinic or apyrimidinic site) lyase [Bryobacteraceae bacterium]